MARLFQAAAVLTTLAVLGIGAAPAPAAKGVKKTHEHHLRGKVVSVQLPQKGKHGTLTIQVTHHKHKKGQNGGTVAQTGSTHTLTINHHTHVHGTQHMRHHGLAALHAGEHVSVLAHHHHADLVYVHHHHKNKLAKR